MDKNKLVLTNKNYFGKEAEELYFGSSSFKAFDIEHTGSEVFGNFVEGGCEAREVAVRRGEYEKPDKKAFLVGSYIHAWAESPESFQEFVQENYSKIYTSSKVPKLRADFERAELMIEKLRSCEIVTDMKNCDHEIIFTGTIAGVDIKIMVDLLDIKRGYFADYKTTADINKLTYKNGKKLSFIDVFDYKLQFAIYSEIIRQNIGKNLDCYVIVVDKKPTVEHQVIYMGNADNTEWFSEKLEEVELKLPHLYLVKHQKVKARRCEKCAYCISTRKLTGPISLDQFEEGLR